MAITYTADHAVATTAAITSSSITVASGDLIVLMYSNWGVPGTITPSNSGTAITWNLIASQSASAQCPVYAWYGIVGTGGTITCTVTHGGGAQDCNLSTIVHTGVHATNPVPSGNRFTGHSAVGSPSQAITPTATGSALWMMTANYNAQNNNVALSGCTIENIRFDAGNYCAAVIRPTTQPKTDATALTIGVTNTSVNNENWVAFEVQIAGEAPPPPPPTDITGKGKKSLGWIQSRRRRTSADILYQQIQWGDIDTAEKLIWNDWFFDNNGGIAIAINGLASTSLQGELTTAIPFTLSSLAQTTVTNLLTTKISFIQSLDVISTINSSLSTNIKLTNVAQANVSLSNTLTTTIALACSAQATTTVNSELKKKPIYIQQRNHTYDYNGKGWFNSDIVDVKGLFDKDLIILANPAVQLSAINSSLATVTNNLSTNLRFNNSAVAQATVTNLITSKISLATNLNVQTTNNTVLTSAILLNNSSQANVVLTSNLSTAIPLVNIAQAVASVSSNVITKIALINTANNIATFNETLITKIPLNNNCLAQVSVNENLSTAIKLTNNAQAVTLFNTVLNGNLVLFTNNALASSTFTETLTTGISLSNTAQSISNVINNVSTTIKLSSAFTNNSLVNATLSGGAATLSINAIAQAISESSITTSIKLAAIANTQSSVLNDLSTSIYLNTNSIAQAILTGSITTGIALNTFTQAVTSANNTLEVNQGISLSSLLVNNSVYNINLQTAISLINNAYSISNFNSTLFSLSSSSIKRKYTILPEVRIYNVKAEQRGYNVEKE